jgi:hypothetical protein
MKIVVHAGMAKTGSSAIQNTLAFNRDTLLEQGVIYPYFGPKDGADKPRWNNHWLLMAHVHPDPENYHFLARKKTTLRDELMEMKVLDALRETLAGAKDDDVVLLSGEGFGRGKSANGVETVLLPLMKEFTSDIHCIAYARPPLSHYPSSIQQGLKSGQRRLPSPSEWATPHVAHHRTLKRLFSDRYTVRIFAREALHQNDVIQDFLQYLHDVTGRDLKVAVQGDANESLTANACSLMFRYISTSTPFVRKDFQTLKSQLRKFENSAPSQTKFHIPASWNAAIAKNNSDAWNSMLDDFQEQNAPKEKYRLPIEASASNIERNDVVKHFNSLLEDAYADDFIKFLKKNGHKDIAKSLRTGTAAA